MPNVRLSVVERLANELAVPFAQGAIAPSSSDSDSSGTSRAGIEIVDRAEPLAFGQAPCGELNEKARGVISGMLTPQYVQARRRENSRSPPS